MGTKKQAQQAVKETAKESGQYYVTERWLGGTLTNFATIKRSIARLKQIEKMETDGTINNYVKQEQSMIRREAARLVKFFEGIRAMEKLPAAMFVVDIKREHNAVAEARRLKIPVVAIVDTNCDPDLVDYPVAGNDDAIRSVRMILATVAQVITAGPGRVRGQVRPPQAGGRRSRGGPGRDARPGSRFARGGARARAGQHLSLGPKERRARPPAWAPSFPAHPQRTITNTLPLSLRLWPKLLLPLSPNCAR